MNIPNELHLQSGLTDFDRELYDQWEEDRLPKMDLVRTNFETVAWQAFNLGRNIEKIKSQNSLDSEE